VEPTWPRDGDTNTAKTTIVNHRKSNGIVPLFEFIEGLLGMFDGYIDKGTVVVVNFPFFCSGMLCQDGQTPINVVLFALDCQ
jgi:hypothetical protein